MTDRWIEPSEEQDRIAERVHHEMCDAMNLLGREGIDPRVIVAGSGRALVDLLTCAFGPEHVAPWFADQARLIRELRHPH